MDERDRVENDPNWKSSLDKTYALRINTKTLEQLRVQAGREERSVGWVMRKAIWEYLNRENEK